MCQSHQVKAIVSKSRICVILLTSCFFALATPPTGHSGTRQNRYTAGKTTPQHSLWDLCVGAAWRVSKQTPERSRSHMYVVARHMGLCVCVWAGRGSWPLSGWQTQISLSFSAAATCRPAQGSWHHPQHHESWLGCCSWACGEISDHLQTGEWRGQRSKSLLISVLYIQVVLSNTILKKHLFFFLEPSIACALLEPSELMNDEFICIIFDWSFPHIGE